MTNFNFAAMPDEAGFFGAYGGQFIPDELKIVMDNINDNYKAIRQSPEFQDELARLLFADAA